MAFTDVLKGAYQSFTGNIDTAVLVVDDYRDMCKEVEEQSMLSGKSLLQGIQSAVDTMESLRSAASQALSSGVSPDSVAQFKKPKYFKVQFNPSELQLDSALVSEEIQDAQTTDRSKTALRESVERPSVTLSVTLYFDQFNKADAFRSTVLNPNLNAADIATNVATGIAKLAGKTFSVQPQVEAILAALYNNYTRYITFCWTDFSFTGYLVNASAQYTMFSTSGNPIRASVSLRIQQELDPVNLNSWYKNLDTAFGRSGVSSLTNSLGSLLHSKL